MLANSPEIKSTGQLQPDWLRMNLLFRDYVMSPPDPIDSSLAPIKKQRLQDLFDTSIDDTHTLEKIVHSLKDLPGEVQLDLVMYICGYTSEMAQGLEAVARYRQRSELPLSPETQELIGVELGSNAIELHLLTDDDPDYRELQWQQKALCGGLDLEVFFPEGRDRRSIKIAKAICGLCSVRDECLGDALRYSNQEDTIGMRGGVSAGARKKMRKERLSE